MLENNETRLNQVRKLIDEADAELRDGKGVAFASSAALAEEIARRVHGRSALTRGLRG